MSNNTSTSTITTANTANTDNNGCNNNNGRSSSYVRKQYLAKVIGKFPSQCHDESGSSSGCSALPILSSPSPADGGNDGNDDQTTSIAQWEWIIDRNNDNDGNNDDENTVVIDNNKIYDSFSSSLSSSSLYNVATSSTADNDNDNATTTTTKTTATAATMNNKNNTTNNMTLKVNGPIETIDPANGVRSITSNGKPSISLFRLLNYDPISNTSIIICEPKTGRSHQLRVHLKWLGHSICGDILYGGGSDSGAGDIGACDGDSAGGDSGCTAKLIDDPSAGINRLLDSINDDDDANNNADTTSTSTTTTFCSGNNITRKQAHAAKEVCPTCSGIHSSSGSNNKNNSSEGGRRDDNGDGVRNGKGTGHPSTSFTSAQLLQGGHAICLHAFCYSLVFPNTTTATALSSSFKIDLKVDLPPWASHLRNK